MALSRLVGRRGILGHRSALPANFGRLRTAPRPGSYWLIEQMFDGYDEAQVWRDARVCQAASDQNESKREENRTSGVKGSAVEEESEPSSSQHTSGLECCEQAG